MILRTDDQLEEAIDLELTVYCAGCHEPVDTDELAEERDVYLSLCCQEAAYVKDGERAQRKLTDRYGPAWASFVAVPRALLRMELGLSTKLLAVELVDWMRFAEAYPAEETLAAHTGMSPRTVRRGLGQLERMGLIRRRRRHRSDGAVAPSYIDLEPLREAINQAAILAGRDDLAANLAGRTVHEMHGTGDLTANLSGPNGQSGHHLAANLSGEVEVVEVEGSDQHSQRSRAAATHGEDVREVTGGTRATANGGDGFPWDEEIPF